MKVKTIVRAFLLIFTSLMAACGSDDSKSRAEKDISAVNRSTVGKPGEAHQSKKTIPGTSARRKRGENTEFIKKSHSDTFAMNFNDTANDDESEQTRLLDQVLYDQDPERRKKAIEALDDFDGEKIIDHLKLALDDPDSSVRIAAVKKLADIELFEAVNGILYALNDSDARVVLAAIDAIQNLADESLIPRLEKLGDHSDLEVRNRAKEVIEYMD